MHDGARHEMSQGLPGRSTARVSRPPSPAVLGSTTTPSPPSTHSIALVLVHLLAQSKATLAPTVHRARPKHSHPHPLPVHCRSRPLELCADNRPFSLVASYPSSSSSCLSTTHCIHTRTRTFDDPGDSLPLIASSSVLPPAISSVDITALHSIGHRTRAACPTTLQNFFVRSPTSPRPFPPRNTASHIVLVITLQHNVTTTVVAPKGPPVIV